MAFTKAQTDAMNARGRALLVSAAAGSGKTFTLTRRIIDSIIEDESKTLSRMLIVTFTRSAAAELKKKISDALSEAISAHPENARLQDELLKLGSAHISTIDSFLSAPVRENFEKLGLPASMRLADDAELAPIRDSIFKETLDLFFDERSGIGEGELAEIGHRSDYTELLSLISGIRDSSKLIPTLLNFYMKTLTVPGGVESIKKSAERLRSSVELDFFETEEGKVIRDETVSVLESAENQIKMLKILALDEAGIPSDASPKDLSPDTLAIKEKVIPTLDEDLKVITTILGGIEKGYESSFDLINGLKFKNYPGLKDEKWSSVSELVKLHRTDILQPVKNLKKSFFAYSTEHIKNSFAASSNINLLLYDLLSDFDRRYSAEKLSRGICEFSDMPRFVLKLLMNTDGTPTPLALSMQKQYDEVYIDEYQDVNAIQDKIFEIIGGDRRFMVGDIKQSIYCFRDAEPSIFASYRAKFPQYDSEKPDEIPESGGSSIFMSENFRCDRGIIDFVNAVCGEIFKAFADSIGYDKSTDDLRFGKISASFDPPKKTVINFIEPPEEVEGEGSEEEPFEVDENEDKLYAEAVVCANEIARLIRDKNELNADGSPVRAGDIAILVRGHSQIIPLTNALNKIGIKYVTNAKNRLLDSDEMKLLIDILTVIDNPREDIPLCRVLSASLPVYSPLLTLDDIVAVRCASGNNRSLFDALVCYGKDGENKTLRESCQAVIALLDSFRALASRVSADKLLRAMSRNDAFASLCETDAFTYLYSNACKYVKSSWNGLYSFNTYFKGLMEKGSAASEPITAQSDEVTIITMHQSKGLEYKVCFLFGLGKSFNMQDLTKPIIFNRELGFSMKLPQKHDGDSDPVSSAQMVREENILWRAASLLSKNKLLEEEARIFYVALTRAKERLYLSATLKKSYDELRASITDSNCDTVSAVISGKSYASWTIAALLPCLESDGLFEINRIPKNCIPPLADRITREEVDSSAYGITEEDKAFAKTLNRPHGESESEKLLSLIPAKVAASKVSPTMLDDSVFIPTPTGLLFSEDDDGEKETGADNALQIGRRIALMRSQRVDFDSLLEVNKKPTAAERGSAAHLILQYCDYGKVSEIGLDGEIERLVEGKFITSRTADIVNRRQLAGFFESSLFELIQSAKMIRREFHFGMFRPAADFTANEVIKSSVSEKKIFVQGSIDLSIETEDGIILCDYKTDRITAEERADRALFEKNMREKHAAQLEEYRFAVKEIFGKEPYKVYIYSIPLGEVIEM